MLIDSFSVYNCESSRQVLAEYFSARQQAESGFSLRGWARELGFDSHTLLRFWLIGKRKIKLHHSAILCGSMKFNKRETSYFENLILIDNAKSEEERDCLVRNLANFKGYDKARAKIIEEYKVISHWIHMALLALREFSKAEAHKKFGHLVQRAEIEAAIYRLERMGLLEATGESKYFATETSVTTRNDIADSGAREYFRTMSDLAKEAVEKQPVEVREFQGLTINVDEKSLPLAKKAIREFRREFNSTVGGGSDNVYQLNLQFFQLSRIPCKKTSSEGCDGKLKGVF